MTPSSSRSERPCLAYIVSSHGFGHAARASAVMQALLTINPKIRFVIYTQSPQWFFQDTLSGRFEYESVLTDIGMVQQNPTREDFDASLAALDGFQAGFDGQSNALAKRLVQLKCQAVLCDISPLGLAAARLARLPSILIENFTWDWIYNNYQSERRSALKPYSDFMSAVFASATYRIQTEPVCERVSADLSTLPVSRTFRIPPAETRSKIGVPAGYPMIVITMGGVSASYRFVETLESVSDIYFVIPGAVREKVIRNNLILLPEHSEHFHPDLIHASDAVIGKVGYSTLAEVYHAGVPFGYVARPAFPESPPLTAYIEREMTGIEFAEADFYDGAWIERVPELIKLGRTRRRSKNGADQIARYVTRLFNF